MPGLAAFLRLSRVKFLAGGFVGGALGTAMAVDAGARFDPRAYALAQATITAFHVMTHYANDYFDRHGDVRAIRTPYSGGSGALVDGSLRPEVALAAALACATLGSAGAALLGLWAGAPFAALAAVAIGTLAWAYSAPPLRLLARGLGELDTALVVAMLVPLCAFAAQRPPAAALPMALASTLPGAAAMLAMMLAVEIPDRASDAASGKRNLVVRFGMRGTRRLGIAAATLTYAAVALAVLAGAPPALAIFEALSLPPAVGVARAFAMRGEPDAAADETLAARGVAFFFLVSFDALLAYAASSRG